MSKNIFEKANSVINSKTIAELREKYMEEIIGMIVEKDMLIGEFAEIRMQELDIDREDVENFLAESHKRKNVERRCME